jgi:hypothetical protein
MTRIGTAALERVKEPPEVLKVFQVSVGDAAQLHRCYTEGAQLFSIFRA